MTTIYRPPVETRHECLPPMRCSTFVANGSGVPQRLYRACPTGTHEKDGVSYGCVDREAAEPLGSVWQCDVCGLMWTAYDPTRYTRYVNVREVPKWRRSSWRERRRAVRVQERLLAAASQG